MNEAEKLAMYVRSLPDFTMATPVESWDNHMGAILTDAVLQAGISYDTVVLPRVERIFTEHPDATTTSAFARLTKTYGLAYVLNWKGARKLRTLEELVSLLLENGVETTNQLRAWLETPANLERLKKIPGIKDKTAHYLQILVGSQTVAVDRHLLRFVSDAGIPVSGYDEAHRLIREAAAVLGVEFSVLDSSIWRYMSQQPGGYPTNCAKAARPA